MPIIESIRNWLITCPCLRDGLLNADYLGPEVREYTIDTVPCAPVLKHFVNGDEIRQFVFVVASREQYGADTLQALSNHGFYEEFAAWVKSQNRLRKFPALDGGRSARKIETTTGGYVLHTGAATARYQIQCRLEYYEKGV